MSATIGQIYVLTEDYTDQCWRNELGMVECYDLPTGTRLEYHGLLRGRDGGPSYITARPEGKTRFDMKPVHVPIHLVRPEG